VKKGQNGRKSLRKLKPTVDCKASKRRRRLFSLQSIRDISEERQVIVGSTILHHRDDPYIIKYSESMTKQRNTTR